jgi:hypothetical protein
LWKPVGRKASATTECSTAFEFRTRQKRSSISRRTVHMLAGTCYGVSRSPLICARSGMQ